MLAGEERFFDLRKFKLANEAAQKYIEP